MNVVKLQAFDPDMIHVWKMICDVSRRGSIVNYSLRLPVNVASIALDFEYIYKELDVKLIDRGESFYQSRMITMIEELEAKSKAVFARGKSVEIDGTDLLDVMKLEEGRQVMFVPNISVPMTIVKSNGSYTYDTSDMATIKQRLEEEDADWIVYVVDSGQVRCPCSGCSSIHCFISITGTALAIGLRWSDRSGLDTGKKHSYRSHELRCGSRRRQVRFFRRE